MISKPKPPDFSICMCNYNMAQTIELSLRSILDQVDNRFEVLVVDDGSTDDSVNRVQKLQSEYHNLRLIPLQRDSKRKVGLTRNYSVQQAKGEYVILHFDCDDIFDPVIKDFTNLSQQLMQCFQHDIVVVGHNATIGRRDFLLEYGPYRNLFRGEDWDFWNRLAANNAYLPLVHTHFRRVLPRSKKASINRAIFNGWDQLINDFRFGLTLPGFAKSQLWALRYGKASPLSSIYRTLIFFPCFLASKLYDPLPQPMTMAEFKAYHHSKKGVFADIMARSACKPDWSAVSSRGHDIFGPMY